MGTVSELWISEMASTWQKVRAFLGEFAGGLLTAVVLLLFIVSIPLIEPFVQHFWVLQERVSHAIHPIIVIIGISLLWLAIASVILLATDDNLLIEKPRSLLNCVLTSMAAASPVLTLVLWYYLGVPPITSYYTFFGIDFYYAGTITFLVAYFFLAIRTIKLPRLPSRMRRLSGWTVVIGANLFFLITPVGWC
jgi:hypothetical protein